MFWFGVTFTFACPVCHKLSEQRETLVSPTGDPKDISPRLGQERLCCSHCKTPLIYGNPVDVEIEGGTPESLRESGFPLSVRNA